MLMRRRIAILGGAALAVVGLGFLVFWGLRAFLVDQAGSGLVDGDYEQAVPEMRLAANMGDSTAQMAMGTLYAFGEGVPKNDDEAIKWLRRAGPAPEDVALAMYAIGMIYLHGQAGTPRDPAEALKWFTWSAEGGYGPASQQLKVMQANSQ